jgi:DNA-binding LytR/AlgR family response regulator
MVRKHTFSHVNPAQSILLPAFFKLIFLMCIPPVQSLLRPVVFNIDSKFPLVMTTLPTVLIIDHDREAAAELTRLLESEGITRVVATASSVATATEGLYLRGRPSIDCLFIRIQEWDAFFKHRTAFPDGPLTIVFLSGRGEKCTRHLASEVDFHLQPPFRASRLAAIFRRRSSAGFQPRPLDFFFLKVLCRYRAIRFDDILEVRARSGLLTLLLKDGEYTVTGSLTQFQHRLPVPSERVRRGVLLIHHA